MFGTRRCWKKTIGQTHAWLHGSQRLTAKKPCETLTPFEAEETAKEGTGPGPRSNKLDSWDLLLFFETLKKKKTFDVFFLKVVGADKTFYAIIAIG